MPLGIMHDLAVGVHPNSADAWALQDVLALGVTAGAPPDEFNQLGQDWSQPPWRPDQLEEQEYLPFRALIQTVLRHGAGFESTTSSGCFDSGGFRRGRRRPRAPTCATTMRR